jgi:hypothetical protein
MGLIMGNMSCLADSPVTTAISEYWRRRGEQEEPRRYLGASAIGHECDKYLWLSFRGVVRDSFEPRMLRLFNRGHREEEVFVAELRGIGCEVWDVNPETGLQWAVNDLGGHFSGHLDGIAIGIPGAEKTPHVLEFKTHGDSSFTKLVKEGMRVSKPQHWAQVQVYMGTMRLDRALYLAVNKNTDEVYAERVHYDASEFKRIMARAKRIIEGNDAERCATRPDDWRCKLCAAKAVCWHEGPFVFSTDARCPIDCRSCCHATARTDVAGARWECAKGMATTTGKPCGCKSHLALPALVDAEPSSATEDGNGVVYKVGDGEFTNGAQAGQFSTEELARTTLDVAVSSGVQLAKEAFNGTIDYIDALKLPERYPVNDSEIVWKGSSAQLGNVGADIIMKHAGTSEPSNTFETDEADYWEYDYKVLVAVGKKNGLAYIVKGKE